MNDDKFAESVFFFRKIVKSIHKNNKTDRQTHTRTHTHRGIYKERD